VTMIAFTKKLWKQEKEQGEAVGGWPIMGKHTYLMQWRFVFQFGTRMIHMQWMI